MDINGHNFTIPTVWEHVFGMSLLQAKYWIVTLSSEVRPVPFDGLPPGVVWMVGQKELGSGGFLHWQFVACFDRKLRCGGVARIFPGCHAEATRSVAAISYVQKEDTRVAGSQFEFGSRPVQRSNPKGLE